MYPQYFFNINRTASCCCSSVLFFSRLQSEGWLHHGRTYLCPVILIDSSTQSPVHVLMLSIQAVRGLPHLRAPGIVPCIISFSRQLACSSWCDHSMLASFKFLALEVSNSSLFTPAVAVLKKKAALLLPTTE